jgi:hypothetical protein
MKATGTSSGELESETVDAKDAKWNPYFRIDCNRNDNLTLSIVNVSKEKKEEIGQSSLICSKFIK